MNVSTLRPGLLVSLKTSVVGNTEYQRFTIEPEHITEEGTKQARWETKRVVTDPTEREKASQVRSQCRGLINRVCSASTFGLLCPEDKRAELDDAVRQAQAAAREFNEAAILTRVHVYVIAGRIAPDDVEAVRAINSEVRELLADMEAGLRNLDVKAVRDAANKAKSIGRMMAPEAASRIKAAVDAAREAARKIVKAGEEAAQAIDGAAIRRIAESRTAFLDLDSEEVEIGAPAVPGRAVDLEPEETPPLLAAMQKPTQPEMEI
jgi:hypothetical protein